MAISIWRGRDPNGPYDPSEYEVSFEGAVLAEFERNFHDDSDFYAVVWDAEAQDVREIQYATTRGWTYRNSVRVDATDEVRAAAGEVLARRYSAAAAAKANAEARVPKLGSRVRVVKGRKVPVGTEGTVFWVGPDRYKSSKWGTVYRVGIKTADGKHFTSMSNVEVVDPETFSAEAFYRGPVTNFVRPSDHAVAYALATARAESLSDDGYERR